MATYRLYLLAPDGRIVSGEWIEANCQAAAEAAARGRCRVGVPSVELWLRGQRVGTFDCGEQPVPPQARP